jgi:hypothetical protein
VQATRPLALGHFRGRCTRMAGILANRWKSGSVEKTGQPREWALEQTSMSGTNRATPS